MRAMAGVCLLMAVLVTGCPEGEPGAPPNGTFEAWSGSLPVGWQHLDGVGQTTKIAGYSGNGLLLDPASGEGAAIRSAEFPVQPNVVYHASISAWGAWNLTARLNASVVWLGSGGVVNTSDFSPPSRPTPESWTTFNQDVLPQGQVHSAYIVLRAVYMPAYIDDVSLTQR